MVSGHIFFIFIISSLSIRKVEVEVQVYNLISTMKTHQPALQQFVYLLVTGSIHSSIILIPRGAYSPKAISEHWT